MTSECEKCGLYKNCNGVVPSEGPKEASLLIVGESPGVEEDREGRPFIGDTGRLLSFMLRSVNLNRSKIRITNSILCYSNQIKLKTEHVEYCRPFLQKEISILPKLKCIIAFGNFATYSLLGRTGITDLNGYWWEYEKIPVLTLLHPSHTLREINELDIQIKHLNKVWRVLS